MQKNHPFYRYFDGTGNHEAAAILHGVDVLKQMNDSLQAMTVLLNAIVDRLDANHRHLEAAHEKLDALQAGEPKASRKKKNIAQAG